MVTDKSAAAFGGQKLSEAKTNKTIYLVDARVLGVGEGGGAVIVRRRRRSSSSSSRSASTCC
jgi:hypothetical protein